MAKLETIADVPDAPKKDSPGMYGPIVGAMIISEDEASGRTYTHRGGGRLPGSRRYGFFDNERGIAFSASMSVFSRERMNPRHRHDFDQVRFFPKGGENYGKEVLGLGDCIYIPENCRYGPTFTAEGCDENVRINLQFPGPSRRPYQHSYDIMRATEELSKIATIEKGVYRFPDGRRQDSYEAIIRHLTGKPVDYPSPRYKNYIVMHSNHHTWLPLEDRPGVSVKHLGYFNEVGPNIKLVKLEPGATLPSNTAPFQQVRFVLDGEIIYGERQYDAVSCMYFPANQSYPAIASPNGATLFVVQTAWTDMKPLPFCLI
ncbi:MAG: hypothetical protein EXR70_08775 [Deltaproteobacteria bacterium]|nr:hypothetical protein [Deltaproteobacteria bacterium]